MLSGEFERSDANSAFIFALDHHAVLGGSDDGFPWYARGMPALEAMFQAAEQRMRPMLMTALSACIGLFPAAISTGIGSQVQRPLATVVVASYIRYVRTSMLEVIRQDYVRTARAKGLSEAVLLRRHALLRYR